MGYALYEYLAFFVIYSFLGWCVEVVSQAFKERSFINRGFLHGPVCPIYGFGLLLVLHFLEPLKSNFLVLFLGSIIFTTVLELITGFLLEKIFSIRWWDYSNEKYNLNGYICLNFSVIWGVACVFVVNIVHPLILGIVDMIPKEVGNILLLIILLLFFVDMILTVCTILKFNAKLERLSQIGQKLDELSDGIGKRLSEEALGIASKTDKLKDDMYLEKLAVKELTEEKRNIIENHLMKFTYYKYFKFHPKIKFKKQKYNDIFEELKYRIKRRKH